MNETLTRPKYPPWVGVKGLFVFKNASVLLFLFFLLPKCMHKKPFIGFVLHVEHFCYYIFYGFLFPEGGGLSFFYHFVRVAKSFRRKMVSLCVFV